MSRSKGRSRALRCAARCHEGRRVDDASTSGTTGRNVSNVAGDERIGLACYRHFQERLVVLVWEPLGERRSEDVHRRRVEERHKRPDVFRLETEPSSPEHAVVLGEDAVVDERRDVAGEDEVDDAARRAAWVEPETRTFVSRTILTRTGGGRARGRFRRRSAEASTGRRPAPSPRLAGATPPSPRARRSARIDVSSSASGTPMSRPTGLP